MHFAPCIIHLIALPYRFTLALELILILFAGGRFLARAFASGLAHFSTVTRHRRSANASGRPLALPFAELRAIRGKLNNVIGLEIRAIDASRTYHFDPSVPFDFDDEDRLFTIITQLLEGTGDQRRWEVEYFFARVLEIDWNQEFIGRLEEHPCIEIVLFRPF